MRLSFYMYSRARISDALREILAVCDRHPFARPNRLTLTSRRGRVDLPRAEIIASAARSENDTCSIGCSSGELSVAWSYSQRRLPPRLWGTLDIGYEALAAYPAFLSELASTSGVFYAICDRESHRLEAMRAGPDLHGAPDRIEALESAYWYNYFGHEFQVPVDALDSFAQIERSSDGVAVLLADSPEAADAARLEESWPVFRSQSPNAAFRPPVRIAFDDVWRVPPASLSPRSPSQVVGPADAFIATVADEAMRFRTWAQQQGLQGGSPHDLREFLRKNSAVILDEWLKAAIAAYGEAVRSEIAGEWSVSRILHRGEPVVRRRSRPWTARRVVLEALQTLSSET